MAFWSILDLSFCLRLEDGTIMTAVNNMSTKMVPMGAVYHWSLIEWSGTSRMGFGGCNTGGRMELCSCAAGHIRSAGTADGTNIITDAVDWVTPIYLGSIGNDTGCSGTIQKHGIAGLLWMYWKCMWMTSWWTQTQTKNFGMWLPELCGAFMMSFWMTIMMQTTQYHSKSLKRGREYSARLIAWTRPCGWKMGSRPYSLQIYVSEHWVPTGHTWEFHSRKMSP